MRESRVTEGGELSDEALLAGMALGDQSAAVTFTRRYQRRVFGLAYSMTSDSGLAEDVAQEAMIRVWRHAPVFDPRRGSVTSWVLTIARNLAIDALRLRRSVPADPDDFAATAMASAEYNPEDAVRRGDVRQLVRGALETLPDEQRRAVVLAAVYGRTALEISESEGIPLGTAKTRIRTALIRLRAAVEQVRGAMGDDVRERGCEEYANELAELALGVLTGRERSRVLSHVESCPRCAEELEVLSRTADSVLQVAPDMEPPLGFEVRLFERMGVTDAVPSRRRRHLRPSRWVPAVVGVAAVALALGIGLSVTSSPSTSPNQAGQSPSHHVVTAALVSNGKTVGHVMTFGGDKPWMSMTLDDSSAHGTVRCVVVTEDGVTHAVGTFESRQGYGAWMAPLPVNPATMRTAEVVSPSGTVIATATLG